MEREIQALSLRNVTFSEDTNIGNYDKWLFIIIKWQRNYGGRLGYIDNNSFSTRILPLLWDDVLPKGIMVQRVFEITSRLSAVYMSSALKLIFLPGFPLLPTSPQRPVSKKGLLGLIILRQQNPHPRDIKQRNSSKWWFLAQKSGRFCWLRNPFTNQVFSMSSFQQNWRRPNWICGIYNIKDNFFV